MRLPFVAHATVRAEFERRWRRVFPLLVAGFLGPPVEGVVTALVGRPSGVVGGWVSLVLGCAAPVVFFAARVYPRRTGWWAWVVGVGGVAQAVGVGYLTSRPVLVVPPLVATALGVVLVVRAREVLLDAADGAVAGTSLTLRSRARPVHGVTKRLVLGYATVDDRCLRWHVGPGPDVHGGKIALSEITAVWVAHADEPPGGPVIAVQAADRVVRIVVGDPEGFAWLLDRRLRTLGDLPPA